MVKERQIVGIVDDEKYTTCNFDPDPPCPETTLPSPDVVAYRVQTRQSLTWMSFMVIASNMSPLTTEQLEIRCVTLPRNTFDVP